MEAKSGTKGFSLRLTGKGLIKRCAISRLGVGRGWTLSVQLAPLVVKES